MNVEFTNIDVLTVGRDEVLILRVPNESMPPDDEVEPMMAALHEAMQGTGLGVRYVILLGDIEVAKAKL